MRAHLLTMAEQWAHHAALRTMAVLQVHGEVEEALSWCVFYLWAAEQV